MISDRGNTFQEDESDEVDRMYANKFAGKAYGDVWSPMERQWNDEVVINLSFLKLKILRHADDQN